MNQLFFYRYRKAPQPRQLPAGRIYRVYGSKGPAPKGRHHRQKAEKTGSGTKYYTSSIEVIATKPPSAAHPMEGSVQMPKPHTSCVGYVRLAQPRIALEETWLRNCLYQVGLCLIGTVQGVLNEMRKPAESKQASMHSSLCSRLWVCGCQFPGDGDLSTCSPLPWIHSTPSPAASVSFHVSSGQLSLGFSSCVRPFLGQKQLQNRHHPLLA